MHRAWRQEARSGGDAAAEPRQAAACTQPLLGCKFCRPQPGEAGRAGGGTGRADAISSAERRVGNEWVIQFSFRLWPNHSKKRQLRNRQNIKKTKKRHK